MKAFIWLCEEGGKPVSRQSKERQKMESSRAAGSTVVMSFDLAPSYWCKNKM